MRHYLLFGTIPTHPLGMMAAALQGALVMPSSSQERNAPGCARAVVAAILLPAVAGTAHTDLLAATGAQEETGRGLHRLAPSSRTKMDNSVLQGDTSRASLALECRARHEDLPV